MPLILLLSTLSVYVFVYLGKCLIVVEIKAKKYKPSEKCIYKICSCSNIY